MKTGVTSLVVKIAERCNLNCSYCYMYNHNDNSYLSRPKFMSDEVYDLLLDRMLSYSQDQGVPMDLCFHGGEPTLIGIPRLERMIVRARERLGEYLGDIGMQTNATLIDESWTEMLFRNGVRTSVSMDGTADIHDMVRVDHAGKGSHASTVRGLRLLNEAGVFSGLLCVINPGMLGLEAYDHFVSQGIQRIGFLIPDVSRDTKEEWYGAYGPTPVADFLIPIFDAWIAADDLKMKVDPFWGLIARMMGGQHRSDAFGNPTMSYLIIESDGSIQPLDVLRACHPDLIDSGLHVGQHGFADLGKSPLLNQLVHEGMPLCETCQTCPEVGICGGGYLAHRYSRANQFDNPSAWCEDIKKLIGHIRRNIQV